MFTSAVVSGNTAKNPVANQASKENERKNLTRRIKSQSVIVRPNTTKREFKLNRSHSLDDEYEHNKHMRYKKDLGLHDDYNKTAEQQKRKKSFLKQIFHNNHKDRSSSMNDALWTVFSMTDGIAQNCLHENEDVRNQQNIPTILLNGLPYNEDDLNEDDMQTDKQTFLEDECVVGGEGLKQGNVDKGNVFYIQTSEVFDKTNLHISIKGPKQKPVKIDTLMLDVNLCKFTYWPRRVGYYTINIQWKRNHIPGSPFDVWVTYNQVPYT